jgi:hypothetical protein
MRKNEIQKIETIIIENFHRVSNKLGMITETSNPFVEYFTNVINYLGILDSGEKCINDAKVNPKRLAFIKQNFENGFDFKHTADAIRAHWYGV